MKSIKILVLGFSLLGLCIIYSCSEDELTAEEQLELEREEILAFIEETPWETNSVIREGVETSDFEGFQLELKDGTFRTINGGQAWPESGTWQFVEGESNQLIRDDGVIMTVELQGDDVEISFTFEEEVFTGGRTKTVQTRIAFILKRLFALFGLG